MGLLNTIRVKYLVYGQELLMLGVVPLCVYIIMNLMAFRRRWRTYESMCNR